MRIDESISNRKYKLDNNEISKNIKNDTIKSIDYREICSICQNHYLKLFLFIEKNVNDDNIFIRIPKDMLSIVEWIEEGKSNKDIT
jgi:hypothetical protein